MVSGWLQSRLYLRWLSRLRDLRYERRWNSSNQTHSMNELRLGRGGGAISALGAGYDESFLCTLARCAWLRCEGGLGRTRSWRSKPRGSCKGSALTERCASNHAGPSPLAVKVVAIEK